MEKDQGEEVPMSLCLKSEGKEMFAGFEEVYVVMKKALWGGEEGEQDRLESLGLKKEVKTRESSRVFMLCFVTGKTASKMNFL